MEYQHIQWISKDPIYVNFVKHYCPHCNGLLKKVKVSRIVNSYSPEAKDFDFSTFDSYMIGNVKFIWSELHCENCNINFTVDEMKKIEKEQQK